MTLRSKLSLMFSIVFLLIAVLSVGSMLIFARLSEQMGSLRSGSEESRLYNELDRNLGDIIDAVKGWGLTADPKYKKQYFKKTSAARDSFGNLITVHRSKEELDILGKDIQHIIDISETVIRNRAPVGDPEVIERLQHIDTIALDIIKNIDDMQGQSTNKILNVAKVGDDIKKKLFYYHSGLIILISLAAVFLIISIRKAISIPFNELLKATELISKGEMSYRIGMDRDDEFGIVAKRFDNMVTELESSTQR